MSSPADHPVPGTSSEDERDSAFRAARRHTTRVRILRTVLPILSIVMLASYGVSIETTLKTDDGRINTGKINVSGTALTASSPEYRGYNKDGSQFYVTAERAVQDIKGRRRTQLSNISARMTEPNGIITNLTASRGFYSQKTKVLELLDDIKIKSSNGLRANLSRAIVGTANRIISSNRPVAVSMPSGNIDGKKMTMHQKKRIITFFGGVKARLKATSGTKSKEEAKKTTSSGQPAFGNPNQPTHVTSSRLRIDDNAHTATFTGKVKADQDQSQLLAPRLVIHYTSAPPGRQPSRQPGASTGTVKRIVASKNIVVHQPDGTVTSTTAEFYPIQKTAQFLGAVVIAAKNGGRITGDRALIDTVTSMATVLGNVVVRQQRNVLRGRRLVINRKAGTTALSSPGPTPNKPALITARFYQNAKSGPRAKRKPAKARRSFAGGSTFRTDPNAPIDIIAHKFEADDNTGKATFTGKVKAKQDEFTLRSEVLIASYGGAAFAGTQSGTSSKGNKLDIKKIRAERKVIVTSGPDQKATGDWADFDLAKNIVVVGGKEVKLTRGKNVITGPKLVINLTTGISRIVTKTSKAGIKPRPLANVTPAPGVLPDLNNKPTFREWPKNGKADPDCAPGRMCLRIDRDPRKPSRTKKIKKPTPRRNSGWSTVPTPR